ncbi:MAG: TIGR00725 family protein [Halobacteria archaeon]|nr:TIGR00725 family protein [Halobacteria archaeon]
MRVSVIGGSTVTQELYEVGEETGAILASRGHTVVCGGLTGIMEAVCKGAYESGGHTIGILPGDDRRTANRFVETSIATGLGNARNVLVALNGDGVIAIDGSSGTLSEIGHSLDNGLPVAGIETHDVEGVKPVSSPKEAVDYIESEVHR